MPWFLPPEFKYNVPLFHWDQFWFHFTVSMVCLVLGGYRTVIMMAFEYIYISGKSESCLLVFLFMILATLICSFIWTQIISSIFKKLPLGIGHELLSELWHCVILSYMNSFFLTSWYIFQVAFVSFLGLPITPLAFVYKIYFYELYSFWHYYEWYFPPFSFTADFASNAEKLLVFVCIHVP